MHDGAPPHSSLIINNYLEEVFEDQWIASNGPFRWPPRSPDLTPLDYFIWGYIKNEVYFQTLTTKEDCEQRVRNSFNSLSPVFIRRATNRSLKKRILKCLEVQGRTFEHLL